MGAVFFRALSYEPFGTQEADLMVWTTIYRTVNLSKEVLKHHLTNGSGVSIDEHQKHYYAVIFVLGNTG